MFCEVWLLSSTKNPTAMFSNLDRNAPDANYRLAFDVVRLRIGDDVAIDLFPNLIFASFCFDKPLAAFDFLLTYLASLPKQDRTAVTVSSLCASVEGHWLKSHYYGSPSEHARMVASSVSSIPHVEFSRNLLMELEKLEISLDFLFSDINIIWQILKRLNVTIIYYPDENNHAAVQISGINKDHPGDIKESEKVTNFRHERFIMTASQRLLSVSDSRELGDVYPEYSWLQYVSEEHLPFRISLPIKNLSPYELAKKIYVKLSIRGLRAPVSETSLGNAYFGHGSFEFFTTSPLEIWQDPEARTFIRALSNMCPEFPIYLDPKNFVVWFGSLVDIEGVTSSGIIVGHPSVLREFNRFFEAVDHCIKMTGLDLSPLVHKFFEPFYNATRVSE